MKFSVVCLFLSFFLATRVMARPNVVLIMADDLGYHDLACYGHEKIVTPVLDRLAAEGVRLTSFYSGSTVCTPSRMALLTGAYPSRLGWTRGVMGYLTSEKSGMSPEALTMADIFGANGYRTGIVGKWHLGEREPFRPLQQGFDSSFYISMSNNQTDKIWRQDELIEQPYEKRLLTEKFTRGAVQFINDNAAQPFLLYVPYSAPHFPLQSHPDWSGKSSFGVYGDVVEELDHRIGELLATLKSHNLEENTIVVFLSDNGPEPSTRESSAYPFRGKKWSALEGGTRVPCIVRWPKKIPGGSESDALISAIDLLPTLAKACEIDLQKFDSSSPKMDGMNVLATLLGDSQAEHPRRDLLYWHGSDGFQAIRLGEWKLFMVRAGAKLRGDNPGSFKDPVLFHLGSDARELVDRSQDFPDRVREMRELAKKRLADIESRPMALGE